MISIVHLIERFAGAGPDRALIAAVTLAAQLGLAQQHTVCALEKAAAPMSLLLAKQAGITMLRQPDQPTLYATLAAADLVVIHFWNNPALYALLRSELPPLRLLIWTTIFGHHAPQVITPALVAFADQLLVKAPGTLALPAVQGATPAQPTLAPRLLYSPLDVQRLAGYQPRAHVTFTVGYIGSVNFAKMHSNYIAMSAGVQVPDVRFIVCGGGIEQELKAQAAALGVADRFDFRGYVQTILPVLAELDVFGYPLCAETYATSERALQEAMWVGIPPVVFPYGGLATLVQHEETGLVVHTEKEYQQAIAYLYHHPTERERLGQNARRYAHTTFDPQPIVAQLAAIYDQMLAYPKRERQWTGEGNCPAEWFTQALGDQAGAFATSLRGGPAPELAAADAMIAQATPVLRGGEGGVIHYRNHYPADPHLRLWSGLILEAQRKPAQALAEYQAAAALGLTDGRAEAYGARVAAQCTLHGTGMTAERHTVSGKAAVTTGQPRLADLPTSATARPVLAKASHAP